LRTTSRQTSRVDVRDRKFAQVVVIACRPSDADVIVRADVGAEAQRPPDGTHVRALHQLGALVVDALSGQALVADVVHEALDLFQLGAQHLGVVELVIPVLFIGEDLENH
jgi:hypothetical protein